MPLKITLVLGNTFLKKGINGVILLELEAVLLQSIANAVRILLGGCPLAPDDIPG